GLPDGLEVAKQVVRSRCGAVTAEETAEATESVELRHASVFESLLYAVCHPERNGQSSQLAPQIHVVVARAADRPGQANRWLAVEDRRKARDVALHRRLDDDVRI